MRIRTAPQRPMILTLQLFDRQIVDRCVAQPHQAMVIKLPILITVGAKPIAGVIVPFVGETDRNAIAVMSPKLFNQPVVQLFRPFALQELDDLLAPLGKLGAISPARVYRVGEGHLFRVTRIPSIFSQPNLLNGSITSKGREWGTCWCICWSLWFWNLRLLSS